MGKKVGLLAEEKPLEADTAYLLGYYYEIGPSDSLSYTEILAWSQLTQKTLRPWEVEALVGIDRKRRKVDYDEMKKQQSTKK